MTAFTHRFHLSACALAVSALLAACGGGTAEPPPDTTDPTLAITDDVGGATATGPVTFTFTFSEDVGSSFTVEDVLVEGGTAGTLTKVDATHYTLVVTPAADSAGTIAVSVAAAKFADTSSNENAGASNASQDFDTTEPAGGGTVLATFDETTPPAVTEFGGAGYAVEAGPAGGTGSALKIVRNGGEAYAGAWVAITAIPNNAGAQTVSARVYSPTAGIPFVAKAEFGDNAGTGDRPANETVVVGWQTLTWTFTNLTAPNVYNRFTVLPNLGTVDTDKSYYIDDITLVGAGGGGEEPPPPGGLVTLVGGVFASNYSEAPTPWRSVEGGTAGRYVDDSVAVQDWWSGLAANDTTPSFYFGYGANVNTKPWGFGAYVSAPSNGVADVSPYSNLRVSVWGNDQLFATSPTLTVILKGPTVAGCTSELKGSIAASGIGVQTYTVPLSGFTLQTACAYASAAAALAGGVSQVHIQVLGDELQYSAGGDGNGNFPNGLNVGPMSFN